VGVAHIRVARHARVELAAVGLYLFFASFQILGPVPIGLADNGDFPKILGAISIGRPPEKFPPERYFVTHYEISRARYLWVAHLPSSEYWVAKTAKGLARRLLPHGHFDIRLMGIVHLLVMTCALWVFMRAFRAYPPWQAIFAGALLLLITTDIEYVQFFSTAYMDAAAIVFFCCLSAVTLNLCLNQRYGDWRWLAAFALFGSLFLGSKLAYQLSVIPLCALAALFAFHARQRYMRLLWLGCVGLFLATTVGMATRTRSNYRDDPAYSVIFKRLAPMSQNPYQVLKEFGLPDQYRKYIGVSPFQEDYLLSDPQRRQVFEKHVTLSAIAGHYLRHPGTCIQVLISDLRLAASNVDLEHWWVKRFRVEDYSAHKDDMRFKWWSSLRQWIARNAWPFGPVMYLLAAALVAVCAARRQFREKLPEWPVVGLVAFAGASTFAVGSLFDEEETSRHIILYQVALDLLLALFLIKLAALLVMRLRQRSAKLMELATTKPQTAHSVTGANHRHL
jgi:hypothetical protein